MSYFYNERLIRKSRKEHKCYLCGQKIEVGSAYRRLSGTGEDGFFDLKLHQDCHYAVEHYWNESYSSGEGWDDVSVMEFVNDYIRDAGLEIPKMRHDAIELFLSL